MKPCSCHKCAKVRIQAAIERNDLLAMYKEVVMRVCPICGYKRCPKASDHELECTNSNEPGQPGSVYVIYTAQQNPKRILIK